MMKWTKENIAELERLYAAGKSYVEIAAAFGCEIHQARYQISKSGLPGKYKRPAKYRTKKQPEPKEPKPVKINPNPITDTTRMIICTSYFRQESIAQTAKDLDRPVDQVILVLRECMDSGYYDIINDKEG